MQFKVLSVFIALVLSSAAVVAGPVPECHCPPPPPPPPTTTPPPPPPHTTTPPPPPPPHTTTPTPPPPPPTTTPPPPPPTTTPPPPPTHTPTPPSGPICSSGGKARCCNDGINCALSDTCNAGNVYCCNNNNNQKGLVNINEGNCQQANLGGLTGIVSGLESGVAQVVDSLLGGL